MLRTRRTDFGSPALQVAAAPAATLIAGLLSWLIECACLGTGLRSTRSRGHPSRRSRMSLSSPSWSCPIHRAVCMCRYHHVLNLLFVKAKRDKNQQL